MNEGERLAALEVEVRHMRESFDLARKEAADLRMSVGELKDILTQARGAKWVLVILVAIGGFLAGQMPGIMAWFSVPKG